MEMNDHKIQLTLDINDEYKNAVVRPADLLLDVLRDSFGLTGSKPGCRNGDCGTCTVNVDGLPMKACLMLAVEANGRKVLTIEGLKDTPIQTKFVECFAFQCGYCTPGFIMNIHALSQIHPNASPELVTDWLQSNICRCTGYAEIREAVTSLLKESG